MNKSCRVAVATTSRLAGDAAREIADIGGNAVDCAVAASLAAMNTEPGVCALAGGAYVTIWHPDQDPLTIDGGAAVPGKQLPAGYQPDQGVTLHMDYGGGMETVVGCAAIAVPGALAAHDLAVRRYGNATWKQILAPSIRATRDGFPLPAACHYYLEYTGKSIFGRSEDGLSALYGADGSLHEAGSTIVVPHLADSLGAIADDGVRAFYEGELATKITDHVRDGGGSLTPEDLSSYVPIERPALELTLSDWRFAINPPPAVGGAVLAAMLLEFADQERDHWDHESLAKLIRVQQAALSYRRDTLDLADDVSAASRELLSLARSGALLSRYRSASTVHSSAVDSNGLACSITSSAGYGSGEMPAGTGLWLNNSVGELELNRRGFAAGPPGTRLPTNMTPGVARSGRAVLAFGSPGADRITTALQQFLINHVQMGLSLEQANAAARLHVEVGKEQPFLSAEEGLDLPELDMPVRRYPPSSMYFGGVSAAAFDPVAGLSATADPRREGGTYVANG